MTSEPATQPGVREVSYECSDSLVELLAELQATLLVSTYQAGKLVAIGASG